MRIFPTSFASLILVSATLVWSQNSALLDRVAIIIEDQIVMESVLEDRVRQFKKTFLERGQEFPDDKDLIPQVIDYLILENLQLQMADRIGIQLDDTEIRETLEETAENQGLTLEELFEAMLEQGRSPDQVKEELVNQLLIGRVQGAQVASRINISEKEIESFLNSAEGQSLFSDEYKVSHILLPLPDTVAEEASVRELAESIISQLREGADFGNFATKHSKSRTALAGGDLGWRKLAELPRAFSPVVRSMQSGDVADVVETPTALHILKLESKRGDATSYQKSYRSRHILLKSNVVRNEDATKDQIDDLYEQLNNGASFTELARTFSEDPNTSLIGGELDWLVPEQLPSSFAQALSTLSVDELSEPFKTDAGWHIVQLLETRESDTTLERMELVADRVLRQRRFEEEIEIFLAGLREDAYIEVKEPWAEHYATR